jgi:hypothetical protein
MLIFLNHDKKLDIITVSIQYVWLAFRFMVWNFETKKCVEPVSLIRDI